MILLDVNDNAPVLPSPSSYQPKINENFFTGTAETQELSAHQLIATDKDEGVNAEVSFRIISITPYEDTANPAPDIMGAGVFDIKSERSVRRGTLVIKKSLQGFYGTWQIEIEAYDHGDEGDSQISLSSRETYLLVIEPHNFNTPRITYPNSGEILRMRYPQNVNGQLYTLANEELPAFVAVDEDGGVYGQVEFRVTGSSNDQDHVPFHFVKDGTNRFQLQISQAIEDRSYEINIAAVDGGDLREDRTDLKIVFVNPDGNPVFSPNYFETTIVENDAEATVNLPTAVDPKNEGLDPSEWTPVYYFLSTASDLFQVHRDTGVLSLKQALEWTWETEEYEIIVIATSTASGPINADENSKLTVKIIVEDVNDKPPKFELEKYGAGITTDDAVDKIILKVKAIDPDKDDVVTYHILTETIEASSSSLTSVKDIAFDIVPNTDPGEVKLQIKVLESYNGYFTFTIQARDLVNHTDEVQCRIYIISESNRVSFIFRNTREEVEEQRTYVSSGESGEI